ncbi:efflux RND transporter periplasmic adaptor subunit [Thiotrichales bacterium 19S3-7]|nr:efflux RND transporter periplasmic adaptor subunit [Thiotrichales bacterium 19S3-7]MCF6800867.1 efflux RND transporter periplasmic adaptor subunit [Thiotrichales bacterium 19S3-11]
MKLLWQFFKKFRFIIGVIIALIIVYLIYFYFYFSTITDNAFVVAKVQQVSAEVSGEIIKINVHNGEVVKKGQPLFSIDPRVYQLNLEDKKYQLKLARNQLEQLKLELGQLAKLPTHHAYQFELLELKIQAQKDLIDKFNVAVKLAQLKLNQTTVYAQNNGIIADLLISVGTSIEALKPLFSLINTDQYWVQANFKETDLTDVRKGNKATIRLKMYLGDKTYTGEVVSSHWAVSRRIINPANSLQEVRNESQWVLPAQRFPVLIKINHPDPNYPLHVGASAYVSIDS